MIERTVVESGSFIDPIALAALRAALPGNVFTTDDEGYDAARTGFCLTEVPTPEVIVAAESAADVVAAVNFGREQHLAMGVQATGHNFGSTFKGGLRVNTSRMQGLTIDPERRIARVEAGVRWQRVMQEAARYGLAPLNGSSPLVGVVGYTLFGGFGWMLRKYGPAVDSVVAVEVVTADGTLRRASETSEPELFWALRGASGNFGIVTALEFKLYPVREFYAGAMFFPMERAREVYSAYSRWVETVPDEMTSAIVMMRMPPFPDVPEPLRGKAVITIRGAYTGSEAEAVRVLQPLRDLGGAIVDTFHMMPYAENAAIANDPVNPMPVHRATTMLKDLSPETIETLLRLDGVAGEAPVMVLEIRHLGGALARKAPDATAFSQRYAPFLMQTIDVLMAPEQAEVVTRNTRAIAAALVPHSTGGVLPSWLGDGDYGVDRMRAGFSAENYARLVALKDRYDPENMFSQNHNIPPSGAAR